MIKSKSTGFALPLAIFYLVIIGAAVAFMAQMQGHQSLTSALSVRGAQAQLAAEAAVEWAAAKRRKDNTFCPGTPQSLTINGFGTSVSFKAHSHTEGSTTISMCDVKANAEYSSLGNLDHVHRRMEATLWTE